MACLYFRSKDSIGKIHVNLLCSKRKVAPLKSLSISRLELCAALLGAQLYNQVKHSLFNNVLFLVRFSGGTLLVKHTA
ncbi:hypothetical protein NQ314_008054 [Rhamnusium bicolor]|uniref:Uncharacterized protein n=1 Tax=Rhamnusium bicolor TaxID=1586634 RepID=A0AAV8YGJ4_9CUCU|nr:hypothetical protein NQ314_008054 [Rhamnusium bicolor]